MKRCLQFLVVALFLFFRASLTNAQSQTDDDADTSAAQAAIAAMQASAPAPSQITQASPALKAEACKTAIPYVESPSGLLGDWDVAMKRYTIDRDNGLAKIEDIKKSLLSDAFWQLNSVRDKARDVFMLCKLTRDIIGAYSPGGNALNGAINVSEDLSMEVNQLSVQVYQLLEKGEDVHGVLKSGTDELVKWGMKEGAKNAGYGQAVAAIDVLEEVAKHMETAGEAADSRALVQAEVQKLDIQINRYRNDMVSQREKLEAIEKLKDTVIAACNEGQPIQTAPEFASGPTEPPQNATQPSEPAAEPAPEAPPVTPWWLAALATPVSVPNRRVQPTNSAKAPQSPQNGTSSCNPKPGDTVCR